MQIVHLLRTEISHLGMTAAQKARWKETRAVGKRRFVWKEGVLKYGVLFLFPMQILIQYLIHRASLTGFEAHPEFDWIGHGVLGAVMCVTFGYSAGAWAWRSAERDYLRHGAATLGKTSA